MTKESSPHSGKCRRASDGDTEAAALAPAAALEISVLAWVLLVYRTCPDRFWASDLVLCTAETFTFWAQVTPGMDVPGP